MNDNVNKEDLLYVIKHGHDWRAAKIKSELENLVAVNSSAASHEIRHDHEDKHYYIYDNECFLFISDGRIELRSDRENVFSAGETFEFDIKEEEAVLQAYEKFKSMTMESEEE